MEEEKGFRGPHCQDDYTDYHAKMTESFKGELKGLENPEPLLNPEREQAVPTSEEELMQIRQGEVPLPPRWEQYSSEADTHTGRIKIEGGYIYSVYHSKLNDFKIVFVPDPEGANHRQLEEAYDKGFLDGLKEGKRQYLAAIGRAQFNGG